MIPTANIIKKERPDDSIGFIDGNPLEFISENKNEQEIEKHIHRIKNI